MSTIRSSISVAIFACANAMAQDRPPKVGETREPPVEASPVTETKVDPVRKGEPPSEKSVAPAKGSQAPSEKIVEPDKTEPAKGNPTKDERKKAPIKRRAVHQIVDGMPASRPPISYGPVLTPPSPLPMPGVTPTSPVPLGSCVGGSCTDTGGTRYNGGVGTTLLSPSGRLCNNNGATVSCF